MLQGIINLQLRIICTDSFMITSSPRISTFKSLIMPLMDRSRLRASCNSTPTCLITARSEFCSNGKNRLMRNLDRRVEIIFPIEENSLRLRILDILQAYLKDTEKLACCCPMVIIFGLTAVVKPCSMPRNTFLVPVFKLCGGSPAFRPPTA